MENVIIVSSDSHAGLAAPGYLPYMDPEYRTALGMSRLRESTGPMTDLATLNEVTAIVGFPLPLDTLEIIDDRGAIRSGGEVGFCDPYVRLQQVEAEGVVAEILNPGGPLGDAPFWATSAAQATSELRAAGARAHNRFLADMAAAAPGRLIGVALIEPWPDMDAAIAELRKCREAGLRLASVNSFVGLEGELPPVMDPFWDPFYAACVELDMPIRFHSGYGLPQGSSITHMRKLKEETAANPGEAMANFTSALFSHMWPVRRPLWQFIWGGVFDRFPELKVGFAECHADWVPPTLEYLDRRHADEGGKSSKLKPSEYWTRSCIAMSSSLRQSDFALSDEIGVETLTFGTDYPHKEGTWPNTLDWLRDLFDGVPEADARKILGENIIDFCKLDRVQLKALADRIGPRPEDIFGKAGTVDPRIVDHFHSRAGYKKFPEFDEREISEKLDIDIQTVGSYS